MAIFLVEMHKFGICNESRLLQEILVVSTFKCHQRPINSYISHYLDVPNIENVMQKLPHTSNV